MSQGGKRVRFGLLVLVLTMAVPTGCTPWGDPLDRLERRVGVPVRALGQVRTPDGMFDLYEWRKGNDCGYGMVNASISSEGVGPCPPRRDVDTNRMGINRYEVAFGAINNVAVKKVVLVFADGKRVEPVVSPDAWQAVLLGEHDWSGVTVICLDGAGQEVSRFSWIWE
jgi:hypothetical protein